MPALVDVVPLLFLTDELPLATPVDDLLPPATILPPVALFYTPLLYPLLRLSPDSIWFSQSFSAFYSSRCFYSSIIFSAFLT